MKWTVEIRSGIRHQLDLSDLKLSSGGVMVFRLFTTEEVTDDRSRQAFVSNQAVRDGMAEIDEFGSRFHSGMFPCFFGGFMSHCFPITRGARISFERVCAGSITSSMNPRLAATNGAVARP